MKKVLPVLVALSLGVATGFLVGWLKSRSLPLGEKQEPQIVGWVDIHPELKRFLKPTDAIFLIVQRPGERVPLAVKRFFPVNFPFLYRVGPEDQMLADRPLEGLVTLTARVDKDGVANESQPGDLIGQSSSGPFLLPAKDVHILIDRIVEEESPRGGGVVK